MATTGSISIEVSDLPEVREAFERMHWRISCLEAMLLRPTCSQCGQSWLETACGPTHAAITAAHPNRS